MSEKRPVGRTRKVSGSADGIQKQGEGLGEGPVGNLQGKERTSVPGGNQRPSGQSAGQQSRPQARPRTPQGTANGVYHGTNGGYRPAGSNSSGTQARPNTATGTTSSRPSATRPTTGTTGSGGSNKGGFNPLILIALALRLLGGGGGSFLYGGDSGDTQTVSDVPVT